MKEHQSGTIIAAALVAAFALIVFGATRNSVPPVAVQTASAPSAVQFDRDGINRKLRSHGLPVPDSLEIGANDGELLIATFTLSQPPRLGFRSFAEDALLAIREGAAGSSIQSYRVTLNGPSPSPGMVRRYGSLRFSEDGGIVEWENGIGTH